MPDIIKQLFALLDQKQWRVVTAESCTGGLIAKTITDYAGSSAYLDCGFVTYSNDAKIHHLGVAAATLANHGAVSEETAREMALGALQNAPNAQAAIAVTGIAGPGGGSADKPVGLVYIGVATGDLTLVTRTVFAGDRGAIREATKDKALAQLVQLLST